MLETLDEATKTSRSGEFNLQRFLGRPLHEVKQARDFLTRLVELRLQEEQLLQSLAPSSVSVAPCSGARQSSEAGNGNNGAIPGEGITLSGPCARKPMRPPRRGTTRAIIYDLLSQRKGEPVTRLEIVQEVGRIRAVALETCQKSVAAVLENKYDPHLVRVRYGEYAYREAFSPARPQA